GPAAPPPPGAAAEAGKQGAVGGGIHHAAGKRRQPVELPVEQPGAGVVDGIEEVVAGRGQLGGDQRGEPGLARVVDLPGAGAEAGDQGVVAGGAQGARVDSGDVEPALGRVVVGPDAAVLVVEVDE